MKKIYLVMLIPGLLVSACSKDYLPDVMQSPDLIALNASVNPSATVIEVYPGDDLLTAIEQAKAAGRGSVVRLMEGTHEVGVTEVREFFGTITGEGKGITVITNPSDIPSTDFFVPGKLPSLIKFIGGDVTISDLSVQLTMTAWLGNFEFNMLLFSDFSSDFMPVAQRITVQLKDIEIKGLRRSTEMLRPFPVKGVRCSSDILRNSTNIFPRSHIDLQVSNCTFSTLENGIYVWGCKKANLEIGTKGGNLFDGNFKGLLINENLGINARIQNNEFNTPSRHSNGIDLNTGEEAYNNMLVPLEVVETDAGVYHICNNTFNVTGPGANAIGLMDAWRLAHPEHPTWMKMIWQDNKFVLNNQGAFLGWTYCIKDALFQKNLITGNGVPYSRIMNTNFYWAPDLPNNTSEGCRFINNHFLRENFIFFMDVNVNNYLLEGDLTNVTISDFGENNRIVGKTNPNHANGTLDHEINTLKEQNLDMY